MSDDDEGIGSLARRRSRSGCGFALLCAARLLLVSKLFFLSAVLTPKPKTAVRTSTSKLSGKCSHLYLRHSNIPQKHISFYSFFTINLLAPLRLPNYSEFLNEVRKRLSFCSQHYLHNLRTLSVFSLHNDDLIFLAFMHGHMVLPKLFPQSCAGWFIPLPSLQTNSTDGIFPQKAHLLFLTPSRHRPL